MTTTPIIAATESSSTSPRAELCPNLGLRADQGSLSKAAGMKRSWSLRAKFRLMQKPSTRSAACAGKPFPGQTTFRIRQSHTAEPPICQAHNQRQAVERFPPYD